MRDRDATGRKPLRLELLMRASLRTSWLAGVAVALIGLACSMVSLGAGPPTGAWTLPAVALLVGSTLLAAGGYERAGGLYGGVITRLAPDRRVAWACRAAVLLTAPLAGAGPALYAEAALVDALRGDSTSAPVDWRTTAGTGMLALSGVLAASAAHLTVGGSTVLWAILLIGSGLALFWGAAGILRDQDDYEAHDHTLLRTGLGLTLAIGGVVLVLTNTIHFHHVGATVAATATTLAVLALVVGPRWLRNSRTLAAERTKQELAARSARSWPTISTTPCFQTLALIQRRAGKRGRRERDRAPSGARASRVADWRATDVGAEESFLLPGRFAPALPTSRRGTQTTRIELVIVEGDAPLDERKQGTPYGASVKPFRTRHATPRARRPRSSPEESPRIGSRSSSTTVDPDLNLKAIAPERRGVRESIIARVERQRRPSATIVSAPGEGCEITLTLGRPREWRAATRDRRRPRAAAPRRPRGARRSRRGRG